MAGEEQALLNSMYKTWTSCLLGSRLDANLEISTCRFM